MMKKLLFSAVVLVFGGALACDPVLAASRGLTIQLRDSDRKNAPITGQFELYTKSYALVIGINDYRNGWPRLTMAVNDAKAVAKELQKRGFEVTLKTDPTSVQLKKAFEEFFVVKGSNPAARLFVWFAGHGHTQGGEGFLIPVDAPRPEAGALFKLSALPMRRFGEYVRLAEAKHAYAVFDSCFAGTVFNSQRSLPSLAVTQATTLPVRQFLTSGDADQTVSDNGTFRELFLRGLNGEEKADANGDGYVTASEMGLFLGDRMTNLTKAAQTPRYGKLRDKDYDRGDFVFQTGLVAKPTLPVQSVNADHETVFWVSVRDSKNKADFEAYLNKYPSGSYAELAQNRIKTLSTSAPVVKRPVNLNWYQGLTATFQGRISSRNRQRVVPVKTYFRFQNGIFEGRYTINKSPRKVSKNQRERVFRKARDRDFQRPRIPNYRSSPDRTHGRLESFRSTGANQGEFRWHDERGSGILRVSFDPHFKSFAGTWVPDRNPNGGGNWSGQR